MDSKSQGTTAAVSAPPGVTVLLRLEGNHALIAFSHTRPVDSNRAQLKTEKGGEGVSGLAQKAGATIVVFIPPAGARVFTDDAAVEAMTSRTLAGWAQEEIFALD